jgi:hypothetical protein
VVSDPTGDIGQPLIGGTSTWYCGNGSPCTAGYSPDDMVAAIDPTLGIPKGTVVTVTHDGDSILVTIVDVCACSGARIIDLTRGAFSQLADPSLGVIPVEVSPFAGLPATDVWVDPNPPRPPEVALTLDVLLLVWFASLSLLLRRAKRR